VKKKHGEPIRLEWTEANLDIAPKLIKINGLEGNPGMRVDAPVLR